MATHFPIGPDDVERLRDCPGCGDREAACISEVAICGGPTFFATDRCWQCGLVFRGVRPSLAWFERMWRVRKAAQQSAGVDPFNPEIERARYDRYAATARLLRKHGAQGRIIDVGSGPATGLRAYVDAGFTAVGLEPDPTRARFAAVPNVEIVEQTVVEYAATAGRQFDALTCQHALEHFHDPRGALDAIVNLVRPAGLVYLEVPDWRQDVRDWNDALYIAHQTNFTSATMVRMAARAGLTAIERAFPPADIPGTTHLAFLFRREANGVVARRDGAANDAPPTLSEVCAMYRRGVEGDVPDEIPLRFIVPAINDLSLTFKGRPENVRATVRENFHGRTARYCCESGNIFVVADK